MPGNRKNRALVLGALLCSALALGGCSISIADLPLVGTPAEAPGRPKEAGAYLPVNELPPDRDDTAMAPAERAKIQKELITARDRQASAATTKDQTTKDQSGKDQTAKEKSAKEKAAKDQTAKDQTAKDQTPN
jgi:hypothetical protein